MRSILEYIESDLFSDATKTYMFSDATKTYITFTCTSSQGMNLIRIFIFCPGSRTPDGGSTSKYLGGGLSFILHRTCIGTCLGIYNRRSTFSHDTCIYYMYMYMYLFTCTLILPYCLPSRYCIISTVHLFGWFVRNCRPTTPA